MSRSTGAVMIAMGLLVASTWWLRFNGSPSVPRGFYWLQSVPPNAPRGTLVVLPVPSQVAHVWPAWGKLLKPIAGIPGDSVCVDADRVSVNGLDVGPQEDSLPGRPLAYLAPGCQTIPEGMVFLASQAPHSLDGRYFGLTAVTTLTATATPLLTWR